MSNVSIALLKNGNLVKVTTDPLAVVEALSNGTADGAHKVDSLDDLTNLLQGKARAQAVPAGETESPFLNGLNRLANFIDQQSDRILNESKKIGGTVAERAEAALKRAKESGKSALEEVRKAVHEASKPRDEQKTDDTQKPSDN